MPWFKVDDNLAFHAKTVAAGNAAMGLWVRAGSWCAQQLTDGHVPAHMVTALGKTSDAKRLVAVGLWTADDSGDGYHFHQWDDRNPRRDQVEEDRAAARERMKKARDHAKQNRQRSANVRANTDRTSDAVRSTPRSLTPTRPDPTRPDPGFSDENPNASGGAALAALDQPPRAQRLVTLWLENCTRRPPAAVIGQVGKQIAALLTEGQDPDDVGRGLATWHSKGLHPSALPSVVNEVMNASPRSSTTDQRVSASLARAAQLRAQETA